MDWEAVRFHSPSSNHRDLGHAILTFLKPGLVAYGGRGPHPEGFSGRVSANGTVHLIGQSRI